MRILIGVSNFGKIKRAEIDVSNFTMFVGNNNSGKSYIMQLIYGLLQKLPRFGLLVEDYEITEDLKLEWGEEWFQNYEKKINLYLSENKEKIVESIFHKPISIESLYLKIIDIDKKIKIKLSRWKEPTSIISGKGQEGDTAKKYDRKVIYIEELENRTNEIINGYVTTFNADADENFVRRYVESIVLQLVLNISDGEEELLFLPASRTGLLLLYKYFFSEKDKKIVEELKRGTEKNYENELGLSAPIYDFLQFLLRYAPNNKSIKSNKGLIDFIEKNLIDGSMQNIGELVYIPKNTYEYIPLYLSSSMVNELAPIIMALSGAVGYQYFFYDEIETCLHPEKQGEMARFLMRLNNSGKRLIVSTHSDTMASKINNLLLLSFSDETEEEKKKKLEKLNLIEEDLLKSENIHVYQFSNQSDGTSVVDELEFRRVPYTGYDFSQFMDSTQNLYNESVTIMG